MHSMVARLSTGFSATKKFFLTPVYQLLAHCRRKVLGATIEQPVGATVRSCFYYYVMEWVGRTFPLAYCIIFYFKQAHAGMQACMHASIHPHVLARSLGCLIFCALCCTGSYDVEYHICSFDFPQCTPTASVMLGVGLQASHFCCGSLSACCHGTRTCNAPDGGD